MKKYETYNISAELGRTKIGDDEVIAEWGRSYLSPDELKTLKPSTFGKPDSYIKLDTEIDSNNKIILRIYLNGKFVATGQTVATNDKPIDVGGTNSISIRITEVVDKDSDILNLVNDGVFEVSFRFIYLDKTVDDVKPKLPHYDVLADGVLIARGALVLSARNPDGGSIKDKNYAIMIGELIT